MKARDGQGRLYNIEVQIAAEPAYTERAVYYLARLFGGQLNPGEPYTRLAKTIGISLCDFTLFADFSGLHSTCRLYDAPHRRELTDVLELHFIELAKFRHDQPHDLRTPFEKWLHVLKFGSLYEGRTGKVPETLKQEEGIEMALEGMRKARASDEVRELLELRKKADHDEATRRERAEQEAERRGEVEFVANPVSADPGNHRPGGFREVLHGAGRPGRGDRGRTGDLPRPGRSLRAP